jgi:hydrogenase small subunit
MTKKRPTIYEELQEKGYSRREFITFCGLMGAWLGLEASGVTQIVKALETKPRLPVIWLHFQECTCCSESFIRSSHPIVGDIVLDKISLDYTETLMAAAGHQAEKSLHDTMKNYKGEYILMVEGSIPTKENGIYCCIGGKSAHEIMKEAALGAKAIIAWGNCASSGCVQAASPNPTATKVAKIEI